jgi:D-apionolactonase
MSDALLVYGTAIPPAARETLVAGPLACVLEQGAIRDLRWDGIEVVRGIAYLLRDRDWGTPLTEIADLAIDRNAAGFVVFYTGYIRVDGATYTYRARIEGTAGGAFSFTAEGWADGPILTNRCGFVVLHPAMFAGLALEVRHTDGRVVRTRFPETISPSQPVFDVRALRCAPVDGVDATCTLEAELPHDPDGRFEMEDQRNWSDASFKTYVGSLLQPWPYRLEPGRRFTQRVVVSIADAGRRPKMPRASGTRSDLQFGDAINLKMPAIGIGAAEVTSRVGLSAIRDLRPSWLVATLDLVKPDQAALADVAALAARCSAAIQLELLVPGVDKPEIEVEQCAALCSQAGLHADAVLVCPRPLLKSYQPTDQWPPLPPLESFYSAARAAFPGALIGGGMVTYFTELNRCRPTGANIDFISHTTAPIVHAADENSVMQTLETLPHIARSVHALWPSLEYRIGPSSIAMRNNPYGETTIRNEGNSCIALADQDPRQTGLFAAAWTVGYAAALAGHRVAMLALHDCSGLSSVLARGDEAWSTMIPDAVVRPVFHVQRALVRASGCQPLQVAGVPDGVALLAWEQNDGVAAVAANLTAQPKVVKLPQRFRIQVLNTSSFATAARMPRWLDTAGDEAQSLEFGPCATAFFNSI